MVNKPLIKGLTYFLEGYVGEGRLTSKKGSEKGNMVPYSTKIQVGENMMKCTQV